jgi:cytochrome c
MILRVPKQMITLTGRFSEYNNNFTTLITIGLNMKKIIISSLVLGALFACNSGDSKNDSKPDEKSADKKSADVTQTAEYKEGLQLIAASDCATCHKVDDKVNGPAYREVAEKYKSESQDKIVPALAQKVITGGSGVWGEVPMTPHPTVSQADAEKMVTYILLLKK